MTIFCISLSFFINSFFILFIKFQKVTAQTVKSSSNDFVLSDHGKFIHSDTKTKFGNLFLIFSDFKSFALFITLFDDFSVSSKITIVFLCENMFSNEEISSFGSTLSNSE